MSHFRSYFLIVTFAMAFELAAISREVALKDAFGTGKIGATRATVDKDRAANGVLDHRAGGDNHMWPGP